MTELSIKDNGNVPIHSMLNYDGFTLTTFGRPIDLARESIKDIPNLAVRDDDVFLSTLIKSGTHWMFEILNMILSGETESTKFPKVALMIETSSRGDLEKFQSPRVLNSHLQFSRLPKQVQEGKCKIVLVVRNPKDAFWSMYKHHSGMTFYNYKGEWKNYLPLLMEGKLEYGSWFDMIKEWDKQLQKHPDRILLVHYEDLKEDGLREIKRISTFLGKSHDDTFLQAVTDKCSFDNMKVDKEYPEEIREKLFYNDFSMFRKGEVGDWQNHFTDDQNKTFDELYMEQMKDCNIKFRFTLK